MDTKLEIYTAIVISIDPKTWIIKFTIPGIMENMIDYPEASPIMNHVYEVLPGQEVIILRPDNSNSTFFYMQSNIYEFIGVKYLNNILNFTIDNYIKMENKGQIDIQSNLVNLIGDIILKLVSGGASITMTPEGNISIIGNINLTGNLNMTGNLLANGLVGSNQGFNGRVYDTSGKSHTVKNGLILAN